MTLSEVGRVLGGPPEGVIRRETRGINPDFVEYSWNLTEWRVGFVRDDGTLRAVTVGTTARKERTPERLGVGSPGRAVERAYGVRCLSAVPRGGGFLRGWWCPVRARDGSRTVFVVDRRCSTGGLAWRCDEDELVYLVIEVYVYAPREQLPVLLSSDSRLPA